MPIVQGDNGRIIEDTFPEPLTDAALEVVIKAGSRTILKAAEIIDAAAGTYKFTLTNSDLAKSGYYMYQTTATYSDGRIFSNEPQRFIVSGKIVIDITSPGNDITDSENGFLLVNGVKLNVYDDSELRNLIEELRTQIGTGTGGEEMAYVQKDVIEGNGNTTVQYDGNLYGFNINNKIASEIEFYINGKKTPVEANGTYSGNFDAFSEVTINSSGAFWAEVLGKLGETITRITEGEQPPADTTAPVVSASLAAGTYNSAQTVTLSSNETATIYYTTNGSAPTESSPVYSSAISIGATTTLKFFGKDSAGNVSAVQSITYTIDLTTPDTTAPTVSASPVAGTYTSIQSVTLSANETATIYYTVDGSTPTTSSAVYSAPISVSANTTIKFFGKDAAGNSSAVQTAAYTINLPDTTAPANVTNLAAGSITSTSAQLTYTLPADGDFKDVVIYNGSTQLGISTMNNFNVSGLSASTQYTLTVKSRDTSNNESSGVQVTFTTAAPADTTAPTVTASPLGGTYTSAQSVTLTANESATIYYTLDGSTPTESSSVYSSAISVSATAALKYFAKDTAGNASAVQTQVYTINTEQTSYVNDASLTFIQTTQSNEFNIPTPENYFNGTGQWTFFSTVDMASNMYWMRRENEADTNFRISVKLNTSNQLAVTIRGKTSTNTDSWITIAASTSTVVDVNRNAHLVLMRDGTNIKLFIDNVLVGQSANIAGTVSTTDATGVKPLRIGEGTNTVFKNAGYYNRALTTEELTQNYNALK